MPGGTLPYLWVVPYAGRNPPTTGPRAPLHPPGMGGVAPLVNGSRPRRPCAATTGTAPSVRVWLPAIALATFNTVTGIPPSG